MFARIIKSAIVAATLATGLGAATSSALADGYYGHHWSRDHGGHHRRHGEVRMRGVCAPWHAVEKARYTGLHRAHVRHITPRRVIVSGYRHHRPDRMTFANLRGCPIIRY